MVEMSPEVSRSPDVADVGVDQSHEREGMSTTTQDTGTEGLVDQAKSELGDVASDVQDKAVELKEQGRSKLGETLDQRTTEAGGQARQAAQVLRQSGSQLRAQAERQRPAGRASAEMAADRVERLGGYLERASGDQLLRDAEDFARRRPWMVAGIRARRRPGRVAVPEGILRAPLRVVRVDALGRQLLLLDAARPAAHISRRHARGVVTGG